MDKDTALRLALEALTDALDKPMWNRVQMESAITAIKDTLEAKDEPVEFFDWYDNAHWGNEDFKEGCHRAWNAAIKYTAKPNQEAKDEPVGYFSVNDYGNWEENESNNGIPLYTTPPQRKPLTDDEIKEAVLDDPFGGLALLSMMRDEVMIADVRQAINRIARAIEAAHDIKGKA